MTALQHLLPHLAVFDAIRRGRDLTQVLSYQERRARDSNPQPLAGHHISSVAANHSLTLRNFRNSSFNSPAKLPSAGS